MKTIKLIFCLALLFSLSLSTIKAQGPILDWNETYIPFKVDAKNPNAALEPFIVSQKASSTQVAGVPAGAVEIEGNLVLKRGDACYRVYCQQTSNCSECKMYWKDRNGDGKIQPRAELRCICAQGGTRCKMQAKKIECK